MSGGRGLAHGLGGGGRAAGRPPPFGGSPQFTLSGSRNAGPSRMPPQLPRRGRPRAVVARKLRPFGPPPHVAPRSRRLSVFFFLTNACPPSPEFRSSAVISLFFPPLLPRFSA